MDDKIILDTIEAVLNAAELRHKVYSANIANVDTPGYKKYRISFEEKLQDALKNNNDLLEVQPEIFRITQTSFRNDGNNVNLDEEIVLMNQNTLKYQALSQ
ncbi:MAG TPA: flagellar basal body rod protein FlgB, partial [bacterium]|nr:flagellar basal body rod protein FlgB [bacterium]